MKGFRPRAISFILSLALIVTMSFISKPAEAVGPTTTFSDGDADHVYFAGDTLTFNMSNIYSIASDTVCRVSFGQTGYSSFTPANVFTSGLTDGTAEGTGYYTTNTLTSAEAFATSITGTIAAGLSPGPLAIQVYIDTNGPDPGGWTNLLTSPPYCIPLRNGPEYVLVGIDTILASEGVTCTPELGSAPQSSENLRDIDITFTKTIASGITGSISFEDLNFFESCEDLSGLNEGMHMATTAAAIGEQEAFVMGIDDSTLEDLADDGATISLTSNTFNGLTAGAFNTEAVSGGGFISNVTFSGTTFSFDVDHFSDYKIARTGSSGGGGGGGGGGSNDQTPPPPKTVVKGNIMTSTATVAGAQDVATGKTVASVTSEIFAPMIEKAKTAETAGQKPIVEISVDSASAAREVAVDIPKTAFNQLADETKAQVSVTSPLGTVTFDEKAVQAISGAAGGDIRISVAKVDSAELSSDIRALVGDAPVYDFTVQSGDSKISDFKGGSANISVPYTLKEDDDPNAVVVYYISDAGALETVRGAYDPDTHAVKFVTGHFSKYAIAYNEVSFDDVAESAWYKDAVGFIVARGITTGTDKNHFSPNAKLTRAQFLVMVMKAYGIKPAQDTADNFADAGSAYYTPYLAKAKELGLANGDGNNLFGPNRYITRQDMFTLLYRTLDLIGEVPESKDSASLSDFIDAGSIKSYAKTPMETFVSAGIITGSYDMLTPQSTSTRAEMAQVLFNLLSK